MAGEMFGTPAGTMAESDEFRRDLSTSVNAAQHIGEIAMQPGRQRLIEAQAGKAEMEFAAEKKLAELSQAAYMQAGQAGGMANHLDRLAQAAAQSGLITKAGVLAGQASLIRQREASALASGTKVDETRLDIVKKNATITGQLFGGVNDEASWMRANALYEFQTGKASPYKELPYSAETVEAINQAALTTNERATAAQRAATARNLANFRRMRLDQHDETLTLNERRLELAEARERRLAKAGSGKSVSGPVKMELDQAGRLIAKDYPDLDPADKSDAAYSIAAEARALRRQNPALDANAAVQQAFQAARAAGDFQSNPRTIAGVAYKDRTSFAGRGKTAAAALPVPMKNNKVQVESMQKGKYYMNEQGVVGKFTGTGILPDDEGEDADEGDDE